MPGEVGMITDYTKLTVPDLRRELHALARDTQSLFGHLDARQLNWRPNPSSWSVAQCFEHVLLANQEMFRSMDAALDPGRPRGLWPRVPLLPRLFGRLLIKSQMPDAKRKFTADRKATPAASAIDDRIIDRFVAHQREAATRLEEFEGRDAARVIMVSPFAAFITYSVLDGCRLLVTHERRHFEQARRVTQQPGFPAST